MKAKKTLFVAQEMIPYVPETALAAWGRKLPQLTQESGREIRTFMPKWGIINERRNQLYIFLAPVLYDEPKHPELQKLDEFQPGIEKRVEELYKLPEPFYGCKELENLSTWG